jgi:hypothetical protein
MRYVVVEVFAVSVLLLKVIVVVVPVGFEVDP